MESVTVLVDKSWISKGIRYMQVLGKGYARGTQGYLDLLELDLEMLSKPLQDNHSPQAAWQMSGRNRTLIEVDSMAAAPLSSLWDVDPAAPRMSGAHGRSRYTLGLPSEGYICGPMHPLGVP
jgi:hypothetical protein